MAHSNEVCEIPGGGTRNETTTPTTDIDSPAKKKKPKWTLEQKLAIVDEAKSTTNRRTAKRHGVSEGLIRIWRKNEAKFRAELDDLENSANLK